MSPNIYRQKTWEEVLGILLALYTQEGSLFAKISSISLILPLEMEEKMRDHIGHRVSVLRTDLPDRPYLFRVFSNDKPNVGGDA
jgi:hypothetical protein